MTVTHTVPCRKQREEAQGQPNQSLLGLKNVNILTAPFFIDPDPFKLLYQYLRSKLRALLYIRLEEKKKKNKCVQKPTEWKISFINRKHGNAHDYP